MSFHQQFRAVPPTELVVEPEWLAAFTTAAWRRFEEECAAGIATAIEKDFAAHALLYTGGVEVPDDPADVRTLPVFGGEAVFRADGQPPFLVLAPDAVARAAAYLAGVDFDALWAVAGGEIRVLGGSAAEEKAHRLYGHRDLAEFYGRSAAAGHAVVKAFRF
ncbi:MULTISPECIES: hypothetical protein [Kitasatospora]|uniref:DUF1877 domain-containing protein n=1 Tax=Kitasatospora setae (strain ATCC 33774 / DSM 43861 / JCM 3304 / KCC A-0304 / NBRC 14216 / KM-6054) TaxID=452652 RepID=E4N6A1_KITSK|nr:MULTISPECIES: hypothetical protein [Kitasatospora]BAJ26732.1 hypothetical protein KSE_08950 [Kitasatospora setae KM-6054]